MGQILSSECDKFYDTNFSIVEKFLHERVKEMRCIIQFLCDEITINISIFLFSKKRQ